MPTRALRASRAYWETSGGKPEKNHAGRACTPFKGVRTPHRETCLGKKSVLDKASMVLHKLLIIRWTAFPAPTTFPTPLSWSSCAKICRTRGLSNIESDWWALACTNSITLSSRRFIEKSSAGLQILIYRTERLHST